MPNSYLLKPSTDCDYTRREVLSYLAFGTATLFGCTSPDKTESTQKIWALTANEIYDLFPETLTCGALVDKLIHTPGANHCLIHLGQFHEPPLTDPVAALEITNAPLEFREWRTRYLKELDSFITDTRKAFESEAKLICAEITDRFGPQAVYIEGVDQASIQIIRDYREIKLKVEEHSAEPKSIEEKNAAQKALELIQNNFNVSQRTINSLLSNEKLIVFSGEDSLLNEKAISVLKEFGIESPEFQKAQADREFFLLIQASNASTPLSLTFFGGNHDFTAQITKFNAGSSNDKFSLIRIRPLSLEGWEKRDIEIQKNGLKEAMQILDKYL